MPPAASTDLRVALDARTLQDSVLGGVGRSLLSHVAPLIEQVEFTLLTDARRPPLDDARSLGLPQVALQGPTARGVAWLQIAAPSFLRGFRGIFHCPFYGLPLRQPVPMVVTIHDLTFETHPQWFTREQRAVFRVQARWAARTARRILTPSESIRTDVCTRYAVAPHRVVVARNLLHSAYADPPPPRPPALDILGASGRYVISVGGAPRRGVDLLLDMWPSVRATQPDVSLVVVGDQRPTLPDGVLAVGALSDEHWRGAVAHAEALCYPTGYEGFGYPAVEACALGTPVVCAPVGALPEVLGSAAHWVSDVTPHAFASALIELLHDDGLRARLVDAGLTRVAAIDRDEPPTAVLRAYQEAAAN